MASNPYTVAQLSRLLGKRCVTTSPQGWIMWITVINISTLQGEGGPTLHCQAPDIGGKPRIATLPISAVKVPRGKGFISVSDYLATTYSFHNTVLVD